MGVVTGRQGTGFHIRHRSKRWEGGAGRAQAEAETWGGKSVVNELSAAVRLLLPLFLCAGLGATAVAAAAVNHATIEFAGALLGQQPQPAYVTYIAGE